MIQETYDAINEVSRRVKGNDGTWTSIETAESHRKMKYNNSETATIAWKQDTLVLDFISEIKRKILDNIFHDQKYIIGKYNLLNNTGEIMYNQMPHRNYQPCKG